MADLTGAIGQVKAHPNSVLNAPRIINAVTHYVPNALALAPAAAVDQLTGPVLRGINSRFGTHFDPRHATDQILNAAGLLAGAPEMSAPESVSTKFGEASAPRRLLSRPNTAVQRLLSGRREPLPLTTHIGKQPQLKAPTPNPFKAVPWEPPPPPLGKHSLGKNSLGDDVVPLSEGFRFNHEQRLKSLEDLPSDIQEKYRSAIEENIIDPILDDPDYGGHNSTEVREIRDELAEMANKQRGAGGNARLADALDSANEDFRTMVNEQQPDMAKELGLTRSGDPVSAPSSAESDVDKTGPRGELASFAQHVEPPETFDADTYNALAELARRWGPERIGEMMKAWKDIGDTANDNAPLPNWAGRAEPEQPPILPSPEDFEPPTPLRNTMTEEEKEAWMKTAANDNGAWDSKEYRQPYLPRVWGAPRAQLPAVWSAPRVQLPVVWDAPRAQLPTAWSAPQARPTNAFSGLTDLDWTTVPRPPRQPGGVDFNSLRPPQWLPLGMTAAANKAQVSQQPQK